MTKIFYFSGTGNSLSTAKKIGEGLNAEVISIANSIQKKEKITGRVIGLVFPVYNYDIPERVKTFLETADFPEDSYLFTVLTCGAHPGYASHSVKKILERRKRTLSYTATVFLPDNSVVVKVDDEKKRKLFTLQGIKVKEIIKDVKALKDNANTIKKTFGDKMMGHFLTLALDGFYRVNNKKVNHESCRDCGICTKVCPSKNIKKEGTGYSIGKKCDNCFACMHWCPSKAISIGKITVDEKSKYHHPEVSVKDLSRSQG